jgi:chromate transporter
LSATPPPASAAGCSPPPSRSRRRSRFILIGAERFDRLRADHSVRAFPDGAGPAAIGAIAGAAIPLALALTETWQFAVLAAAALALFVLRGGIVLTLIAAGAAGALASALGARLAS